MRCAACEANNRKGRRFCMKCGAPLPAACASCGFENDPGDQFCGGCGQSLVPRAAERDSGQEGGHARPRPTAAEGERRQLTVMFCDLVGSTALSSRLDPEELREVVHDYQVACTDIITRLGGHIAQFLGDGLLVYFGYPIAHEDDARRAVRSGLEIVEIVPTLPARRGANAGRDLEVRVGIHTGLVVVGDVGDGQRRERLALGETPNVAARLQGLAEPGTVVISGATHRLVRRLFDCRSIGIHALKGIDLPVALYRVLGEVGDRSSASEPSSPLVGRDRQIALLLERWLEATEQLGQVVLLTGEPGIGKSRLVHAVKGQLAGTPHVLFEAQASPFHQNSPMYAAAELVRGALGLHSAAAPPDTLATLERVAAELTASPAEVVPLLASLLGLPAPPYPSLPWTPQKQKEKTIEVVLAILLTRAARQPVLLIVEDLHWADSSSLELLTRLVEQAAAARVCALLTGRPEFRPPWPPRSYVSHLMLNRLPPRQVEAMLGHITADKPLPAEVSRQILAKADGVPLFVEELTKAVIESRLLAEREDRYELAGPLPSLGVPATLRDSLAARLDRLGDSRAVAQLGATLGREFSWELLAAVSPLDPSTLQHALDRLVEAELLYQRGQPPQATYVFKHALIQDEAYQSLLRSTRQQHHQRVAQVLEERFPSVGQGHPEIAAHHYTQAGLSARAIHYWQRAGENAARRSASPEAIAHFTQAIALVPALPEGQERMRQELALQIALGPVLFGSRGFAAPETGAAYARAHELCSELGDVPEVIPALWGLWGYLLVGGALQRAMEIGKELLARAERTGDSGHRLQAHHALAPTHFFLGEFNEAVRHAKEALALYDPDEHVALAFVYGGHDARACVLHFSGLSLWMLGYPDQGLGAAETAQAMAERLAQSHTTVLELMYGSLVRLLRGEAEAARRDTAAAVAVATESGLPQWRGMSQSFGGSALAALGPAEEGLAEIQQGHAAYRATGAQSGHTLILTLLADVHLRRGTWEEGLSAVNEALTTIVNTEERLCEAELHRLKGEILFARSPDDPTAAELCFHAAIEIARGQRARSWELRAATSLARLWQSQDRREEARSVLSPVLAWFTEGRDTRDLREAQAVLDALDMGSGLRRVT
jgi:predicted ATPase/class 3 adenylate cyclase